MTPDLVLQGASAAGGVVLALYCAVLGRRLRRLNNLETGLGGAIAVMASEVARLEGALAAAQREAASASQKLAEEIEKARAERSLWAVQSQFGSAEGARPRLRRRAEVAHG